MSEPFKVKEDEVTEVNGNQCNYCGEPHKILAALDVAPSYNKELLIVSIEERRVRDG